MATSTEMQKQRDNSYEAAKSMSAKIANSMAKEELALGDLPSLDSLENYRTLLILATNMSIPEMEATGKLFDADFKGVTDRAGVHKMLWTSIIKKAQAN